MPRVNNPLIKKANTETEFSHSELLELKKCAADPVYFIRNYVKIQHPKHGIVAFELRPYQIKMIMGFHEHRFSVTLAARQVGKALSLDTEIPTPSGWTTMKDLQPGDYVFGADGKPTLVTAISEIYHNRPCYNVDFSTGETIIADANHLWEVEYVENVSNKKLVLTTEQILNRGVLRSNTREYNEGNFNIKVTNPLQLEEQKLLIDPYVLGGWLGNGTSNRFDNLYQDLKKLNLIQNKHIPLIYLRSSYNQRLSLLQGIMDTGGHAAKKELCEITLTNKKLIGDVHELISTLGLKCKITERNIKGALPHTKWTITFTPHFTREKSTQKRTIVAIEPIKSVPVKCIVVDNPDHLFLVGRSFIPTHNSVCAGAYLLWYACFNFDKTILIASNKNSNAMEMIHRIRLSYENLPMWLKPGIKLDGYNKHSLGFDNGCRIISEATSESSGRGLSISVLYLDEFSHVAHNVQEEFWTSIEPTLSTGGSCLMTSTPNGDMDIFAQIWRGAQVNANGFFPIEVKWNEPPGRDEKFKEDTIGRIGELKWKQEYECVLGSSLVTIQDDHGIIKNITMEDLALLLQNKVC